MLKSIKNKVLTRRPGRLLPSDLAPILQYGNRPPSDFLAKILGVDTSPFLFHTVLVIHLHNNVKASGQIDNEAL
jgi:hypothetical protein